MEQQHRHDESGGGLCHVPCACYPQGSTHTGTFISCVTLGARRSFWSWETSVTLEQTESAPQTTHFFPPLKLWTGTRMSPTVQPPSPAHSHAQRVEGTAGPGLPSLQHQPHWEPGGEAETMLGTAHCSLS